MNTENFDKQAKEHLAFYDSFMNFAKYAAMGVAIMLLLMAYFLV